VRGILSISISTCPKVGSLFAQPWTIFGTLATFRQAVNCRRALAAAFGLFPAALQLTVPAAFVVPVLTPFVRVACEKSKIGTKAELQIWRC
jgi:hypothetical protein